MTTELQLKTGEIGMTEHAFQRFKERVNKGISDKNHALANLRGMLKQSLCLGEVVDDEGNPGFLFAKDRTAIIITPDLKTIQTVQRFEMVTHPPIKERVKEMHETELRKLRRKEKCIKRRNEKEELKLHIELAQLDYRQFKTRSDTVKQQCKSRKKEIQQYICDMEHELKQVKDMIRHVARSLVSVV